MKYIVSVVLFVSILLLQSCGSTDPVTKEPTFTVDEQEFVLTPETSGLGTTATTAYPPRLIVRLSIKPELNTSGQPTGKRYGQATFIWTDKSAAKGGSDLEGTPRLVLREAGQSVSYFDGQYGAIKSNLELIRQTGYQGHILKSSGSSSLKPLCIELRNIRVEFQPSVYSIQPLLDSRTPIIFCQANTLESKVDLAFTSSLNLGVNVPSGELAVLTPHIMNSGVRPAQNVYATFKVNNIMRFVADKSDWFECSSRKITDVHYSEEVSCFTSRLPVGVQSLLLVFERTNTPVFIFPITGSVRANLSTTSL